MAFDLQSLLELISPTAHAESGVHRGSSMPGATPPFVGPPAPPPDLGGPNYRKQHGMHDQVQNMLAALGIGKHAEEDMGTGVGEMPALPGSPGSFAAPTGGASQHSSFIDEPDMSGPGGSPAPVAKAVPAADPAAEKPFMGPGRKESRYEAQVRQSAEDQEPAVPPALPGHPDMFDMHKGGIKSPVAPFDDPGFVHGDGLSDVIRAAMEGHKAGIGGGGHRSAKKIPIPPTGEFSGNDQSSMFPADEAPLGFPEDQIMPDEPAPLDSQSIGMDAFSQLPSGGGGRQFQNPNQHNLLRTLLGKVF